MSRKYVNEKWCVRCGKKSPTPYLAKKIEVLIDGRPVADLSAIDVGCGNGRNSAYLKEKGIAVTSCDMAGDFGNKCVLGREPLPAADGTIDIALANYILMFLNEDERKTTYGEIDRVARRNCRLMVELYAAKDSAFPNPVKLEMLQNEITRAFISKGWEVVHEVKEKMIFKKK